MPPAAALVHYPPPFGPLTDAEAMQAIERARGLIGLDVTALTELLVRAGADAADLCDTAHVGECLASFCATGAARCWRVSEAYWTSRGRSSKGANAPSLAAPSGATKSTTLPAPMVYERPDLLLGEASPEPCRPEASGHPPARLPHEPDWDAIAEQGERSQFRKTVEEKAVSTVLHVGLRGPAARVAGAAAAFGCEGYALYQDIGQHKEELENKNISKDQFQEKVTDSTISSSGRAFGGLAGAVAGQAACPVPIVGAVVGGVIGAGIGGFQAQSFSRGLLAMTGGRAKGGDDLVRCVEHKPREELVQNFPDFSVAPPQRGDLLQAPQDLRPRKPVPQATDTPSGRGFPAAAVEDDYEDLL